MEDAVRAGTVDRLTYYAAKFTAQTAQNMLLAALFVIAGTSTAAAIGLSSLFVATLLPAILLGLPGGAIVDRIGPARGFALGAILRLLPVVAAVFLLEGATWAWLVAFAYSSGSQVFTPAEMALVKTIQRDAPGRAHSLLVGLQYAGQGTGMLILAPALYFIGGTQAMLIGSAVGFGVLNIFSIVLAIRLRATPAGQMLSNRTAFTFRETCRFFMSEPIARYAVVVLAFKVIIARGIVVALPFYLQHDLGLGGEAIAYLLVPGIAGVVIGLAWAGRTLSLGTALPVMRLSLIGMTVAVFALAALDYGLTAAAQYSQVPPIARLEATLNTTFIVAVPVAFLLGLTFSSALISARVALTETAAQHQQARVFAVQLTLTESIIVLPLMLAGVGTEFAGARMTLAAIGVLTTLALVAMQFDPQRRREARPVAALPAPAAAAGGGG
ncbi:MAG TPA: MFS transporter [Tepidiformaceae bacterium]